MTSINCPACQNTFWHPDRMATQMISLPAKYHVLKCGDCGQRRLEPQLSEVELKEMYSDAYFSSHESFSGSLSDVNPSNSDYISQVVTTRYDKFLRTIARLKLIHPYVETILDVGAATGDFVKLAKDSGLNADGIEFSAYAIKVAYEKFGVELEQLSLAEVTKDNYYDAIHLHHVFEHFNEPQIELQHITRLLKPNGLLYIEIPYQFNLIERLLFIFKKKVYPFTIHSIHHPFFYNPHSIKRFLQNHHFEILKISVFDHDSYVVSTWQEKLKKLFWQFLSFIKTGMNIEVIARKTM